MTVTPDLRFEVSRRIREEFDNGRHYYALHGHKIERALGYRPAPRSRCLDLAQRTLFQGMTVATMIADDPDTLMRMAAFEHVRRLGEVHDHLTATELKPGFVFEGERIPLINPQRGIFKPQQMRFLLSIKTVFPKPGGKVWYDDQREVHRQIFEGDETIDYAFMGQDPDAADNRWLREAFENRIPIIYFLGIAPGRYQAMLPAFISGWDGKALKARVAFGVPDQEVLAPPENALERRYALRRSSNGCIRRRSARPSSPPTTAAARCRACLSRCCWMPPISSRTRTSSLASRWFPTASRSRKSITPPSTPI